MIQSNWDSKPTSQSKFLYKELQHDQIFQITIRAICLQLLIFLHFFLFPQHMEAIFLSLWGSETLVASCQSMLGTLGRLGARQQEIIFHKTSLSKCANITKTIWSFQALHSPGHCFSPPCQQPKPEKELVLQISNPPIFFEPPQVVFLLLQQQHHRRQHACHQ